MSFDARVDATPEVVQEETPQVLTVSQLLNDLNSGIDRNEIRKKYGLTQAEAKAIFSHPKLQGIRVKKQKVMRVQLVDDTETASVYVNPNQTNIEDEIVKEEELRNKANFELVEALNPEFLQPTDSNFHNDNQTEIQD